MYLSDMKVYTYMDSLVLKVCLNYLMMNLTNMFKSQYMFYFHQISQTSEILTKNADKHLIKTS